MEIECELVDFSIKARKAHFKYLRDGKTLLEEYLRIKKLPYVWKITFTH